MKNLINSFVLLSFLAQCAAQEATPSPEVPIIPPNRKQPTFNPDLDMVQGQFLFPETTPVFKPRPVEVRPVEFGPIGPIGPVLPILPKTIPPNRKQPVISKADVVMAATDKIGILVNNLAQNLAMDLNNLLNNLPVIPIAPISHRGGTRALEDEEENDWAEP